MPPVAPGIGFPKFRPPKPFDACAPLVAAGNTNGQPTVPSARPAFKPPRASQGGSSSSNTCTPPAAARPSFGGRGGGVAKSLPTISKDGESTMIEHNKQKLAILLGEQNAEDLKAQQQQQQEEEEAEAHRRASELTEEEKVKIALDEEAAKKINVVYKLPISVLGKLYFQSVMVTDSEGTELGNVEGSGGGATTSKKQQDRKQEAKVTMFAPVGLVIIDRNTPYGYGQLFDCFGRQYGNRADPGYELKPSDVDKNLHAGGIIKIGMKYVKLVTALPEEAFRCGEFFLRTEHESRKKEEKKKEAMAAIPKKKKEIFLGGSDFGKVEIRKRPRQGFSGFVVPLMGTRKVDGTRPGATVEALFDHDREGAVVLFRADYKRDAQNRPICSVVVDPVIGDKLRPHQKIGVQFLYDCLTADRKAGYYGAILADEMGLGKTIQTVAIIWTCLKQGKNGIPISRRCVVVAPSSLVSNWCNEFEKWLGPGAVKSFAIATSTPKGDRILSRFETEGDVLVISYDQLRKYIDRLKTITSIDLIVCDEGHRLKNAEIKTTQAVAMMPTKRRIILSGTPIQNDLTEFHAMVDFVNPGIVGAPDLFKRVFEEPVMTGRDPNTPEEEKALGKDRAHYLANLTSQFILRRLQTINEKYLPPKVDVTVFCGLGKDQRQAYQNISMQSDAFKSTPLVLITALKKLCSHMDLLYEAVASGGESTRAALPISIIPKGFKKGSLAPSSGSKMAFVGSMLNQLKNHCPERDKLVIVSNYTQTLDLIARLCDTLKVSYFQLDGSTPIKKRQELVDQFNVPFAKEIVFLLSSKAGGVGLNLIGANRLILFDPDWNPANDAQAMGRVWRDGQKKRVFLYRLLSTGTIEEKIYQRQVSKQGLSASVVDMKEDSKQHFTGDELKALFTYKGATACDTHDLLDCRCLEVRKKQPEDAAAGILKKKFKKVEAKTGPRMEELKGWMHVQDAAKFSLDVMLKAMCGADPSLVTFLFANERDTQKVQEEVLVERVFGEDEGDGIICNTQADGGAEATDSQLELAIHDEHSDDDE